MKEEDDLVRVALPPRWLEWAVEIQFLAQAGITYTKDSYDLERFERLRDIAAEIMSARSGLDMDTVRGLFCNETGFQTPKMDTRAAIFRDGNILLVRETESGLWSLPGGWVDVNRSVRENTAKEVWEEAGLEVEPVRLIALHDRNRHILPPMPTESAKSSFSVKNGVEASAPMWKRLKAAGSAGRNCLPWLWRKIRLNRCGCALTPRRIRSGILFLIKRETAD